MTTTDAASKPRWVECADKASVALDAAAAADDVNESDANIREADAWMRLAYLYADRTP